MNQKAASLIEIIVSMLILTIIVLGISATVAMLGSGKGGAGASGLDIQAINYARQILEELKNAVSTNTTAGSLGSRLLDTTYTPPCSASKPFGTPCGTPAGTPYNNTNTAIPAGTELAQNGGTRQYTVWDISNGSGGVAYKKVTATVSWNE